MWGLNKCITKEHWLIFSLTQSYMSFLMTNYYVDSIIWLVTWLSCHILLSNCNNFIGHIFSESYTCEGSINMWRRNFCSIFSLRHSHMAFPMTNYYIGSIIWLVQWISFHSLLSNYNTFIVHIYSESHTDEDLINVYQRNFFSFLSLRHSNMTFPRTLFEIISIYIIMNT